MKSYLEIAFTCSSLLLCACSTPEHNTQGPGAALGRSTILAAATTSPSRSLMGSTQSPPFGIPSSQDDASQRTEHTAVTMDRIDVSTNALTSYCLEFESSQRILRLRDYRDAPPEAMATGSGIIWAETGYWGAQIIAIDGVDVSTLGRREWYRMLFYGSDPVRLSMATLSRRIAIIDAYTGKGGNFQIKSGR